MKTECSWNVQTHSSYIRFIVQITFKLKFFKVSVIVVPMSKSLWTVIEASICCANSFAMYNPNPEPPVLVFRESSTLNVLSKIRD